MNGHLNAECREKGLPLGLGQGCPGSGPESQLLFMVQVTFDREHHRLDESPTSRWSKTQTVIFRMEPSSAALFYSVLLFHCIFLGLLSVPVCAGTFCAHLPTARPLARPASSLCFNGLFRLNSAQSAPTCSHRTTGYTTQAV